MTHEEALEWFKEELKHGKCSDTCVQCNANEKAMEALEKQIPKKPIVNLWDKWLECPECGEVLSDEEGLPLGDEIDITYCWCCGQKLEWSDEI